MLADGSGTLAVNKVGSGVATLSGPNTYSGATTISGGALQIGGGGVLGGGNYSQAISNSGRLCWSTRPATRLLAE